MSHCVAQAWSLSVANAQLEDTMKRPSATVLSGDDENRVEMDGRNALYMDIVKIGTQPVS